MNGDQSDHYILLSPLLLCHSVTGKKLMSKCRSLLQENQDLGKQISQGRIAQLEAEISVQKSHCKELKSFNEGRRALC